MQISLLPEEQRRAKERAGQLGISVAEYIRRLVARDLGEPGTPADPSALFNLGESAAADVARDKDRMVREAFEASR
jgi:hypothetical protein